MANACLCARVSWHWYPRFHCMGRPMWRSQPCFFPRQFYFAFLYLGSQSFMAEAWKVEITSIVHSHLPLHMLTHFHQSASTVATYRQHNVVLPYTTHPCDRGHAQSSWTYTTNTTDHSLRVLRSTLWLPSSHQYYYACVRLRPTMKHCCHLDPTLLTTALLTDPRCPGGNSLRHYSLPWQHLLGHVTYTCVNMLSANFCAWHKCVASRSGSVAWSEHHDW